MLCVVFRRVEPALCTCWVASLAGCVPAAGAAGLAVARDAGEAAGREAVGAAPFVERASCRAVAASSSEGEAAGSARPGSGAVPATTAASPIGETSVIGVLSCASSQAARADIKGAIARNPIATFNLEVRMLFNSFRARKYRGGSVHARARRQGSPG